MSTRTNSQFVAASVTEFLSVWSLGGEASLNLTTRGGLATIKFNCTLEHPSAHHSLPPSPPPSPTPAPPPHRPRHLQRESATNSVLPATRKLGMMLWRQILLLLHQLLLQYIFTFPCNRDLFCELGHYCFSDSKYCDENLSYMWKRN